MICTVVTVHSTVVHPPHKQLQLVQTVIRRETPPVTICDCGCVRYICGIDGGLVFVSVSMEGNLRSLFNIQSRLPLAAVVILLATAVFSW